MEANQPVTTILKIKYREGFKEECLQWMQNTASIATTYNGFIEKNICVSADSERELINIFTFRNNQCLEVWENSNEKFIQAKKSELFVEEIKQKSQLAGLEFMFTSVKQPKRWKMVVVTVCVIFILLNSLVPVLQHFFTLLNMPTLLRSLFGVIVMVSLMTFIILPFLSKLLGRWLLS